MAFNRDGTKLYAFDVQANEGNITTYSLPGPFDISSPTSINVTSMMDIGVINEGDGTAAQGFDIDKLELKQGHEVANIATKIEFIADKIRLSVGIAIFASPLEIIKRIGKKMNKQKRIIKKQSIQ